MQCECQSGQRTLRIDVPSNGAEWRELREQSFGGSWEAAEDGGSVRVQIGDAQTWKSLTELNQFLACVLTPGRMEMLTAAWVPGCGSSPGGCPIAAPQRLIDMAPMVESPLMDILRNRRIETWYQPIFRAGSLDIWGYECLMRGRDGAGKLVYPGDLLKWAREEHLIFMLDRICRETHLTNAGAADMPRDATILINFLPTAIYEPSYCLRTTEAAARRAGIDPHRVIFEVVETDEVHDREHLTNIMRYYQQAGYRTALDDVGAGYSGLMMLADLNPDLIKIDRSLVEKSATSKMHRVICKALVQMARDSGKLILAEGIETLEQKRAMDELGADLYQGYYFGRPAAQPVTRSLAA